MVEVHGVSKNGVLVAPHAAAAEAGAEVLRAGGSAVEAMVAAAATIAVVYPHMNGIGGDGFWIIAEPGRPPVAIEGCGPAGAKATIAAYNEAGHDQVPSRGPLAALTVPGTVGGWKLALELAEPLGSGMPLRDLLAQAAAAAKDGITVSRSQAALTAEKLDELKPQPGFADVFLVDGKAPDEDARLTQPKLADTLDHLGRAGLGDFYRGDVGATLARDLDRMGSPVTEVDIRGFEARRSRPLSVKIKGATLFNTPPPTQGLAALLILAIFDRLGVERGEGFDHVHGIVEATKRAFLIRNAVVTDPRLEAPDVAPFLSEASIRREVAAIDMKRAAPWPDPSEPGDTIWMGAIDRNGVAVSFIQSVFWEFGSGAVSPGTGVLLQNRGSSFSLRPGALNALRPGRRPFHTLNPALARFDDGRVLSYGSMGGDGQPQFQAQLFTRMVQFGVDMAEAVALPRWLLGKTWGSDSSSLKVEHHFDTSVVEQLSRAGHFIEVVPAAGSDNFGHAGAVRWRPGGDIEGVHDPRADGGAGRG
ncbi:putative gamma-glutamyltransferase YwrD [Hartmannibacter diazotrophicus]|uniref:Putative gamma-glutamyltransferase YwrD n=1 Tax=Hartmannibacter diazotrophicus TaxID=1482074 RepID=A0A2C9DBV8_9HYPH|nr:gamma-glutamyltransferase [Hartmannibacter diazotrophicus]SON57659.1 putative gamma-glutamyltransferase YwrD [Hartmannibacter diazotrophicus]